jgi:DNA-dependent RNA polymerase auxiliary subunit epsilon
MADVDEEDVLDAIEILGLSTDEMAALVEHNRREAWVWTEIAKREKGQKKRKGNLIAKHFNLRMEKWIELVAQAEMEYEHEHGAFASEGGE